MADRMIPVPESLIKRAKDALLEVPPSSRNADIYGELHALLSQLAPTAEPVSYNGHNGLAVFADAARRLSEGGA